MIPGEIYLANFHFAETTGVKLRPVLLLSPPVGPVPEVIVAYITSVPPEAPLASDLLIHPSLPGGLGTNLKTSSAIRLHKIATLHAWSLVRYLGKLPETFNEVGARVRALLGPTALGIPSEVA
ncbi:MAG: type II toxin-antitoxin system PemK/MazF family toxin [Singulisphaera sp.]